MDGTKIRTIKTSKLKYIRNFEIITTDINIALLINVHFRWVLACRPPQNNRGIKKNQTNDNM